MSEVRPFEISVAEAELEDLRSRLDRARWPDAETDPRQGIGLSTLQKIVAYWRQDYDWRQCERRINTAGSYVTEIDGLDIQFIHLRSDHAGAKPLVLTHGWPGSIVEFLDVAPALTAPESHGGRAEDAFHLVIPSLPGYGFSEKPTTRGWNVTRIAEAWNELMARLGYSKYLAQGGDWGSMVTTQLAKLDGCAAAHVNLVLAKPPQVVMEGPTEAELLALMHLKQFNKDGTSYARQQATRPQTLGYGLVDSPIGQAAWVLEKFDAWSDGGLDAFSIDTLLDHVTIYWLTASAASSARLYWESYMNPDLDPIEAPIGCTVFPRELQTPSRRWAEGRFKNLFYWNEADRGGHFAALEQPELFVRELRACFKGIEVG